MGLELTQGSLSFLLLLSEHFARLIYLAAAALPRYQCTWLSFLRPGSMCSRLVFPTPAEKGTQVHRLGTDMTVVKAASFS